MRVLSSPRVIEAADNILRKIADTYAAPKKTFPDLREMLHQDALVDPLREFSEACRAEFEALGSASMTPKDRHGASPDRPRTQQRLCAGGRILESRVVDRRRHRARHRLREPIGALIGAAYVVGRLGELRQWAEAATWREIVGLVDVRLWWGTDQRQADRRIFSRAWDHGPDRKLFKAICCHATDLVSGREIWLQSGQIDEAVRASIALPGIFRPARIGDKWLVN